MRGLPVGDAALQDHVPAGRAAVDTPRAGPGLRLAFTLGALSSFGPLSTDFYLPGLPALSSDLHAHAWLGQATVTGFLVGLAVGQIAIGPVADSIGRRRPVLAGIAVYIAASLLCAVAPSIEVLLVGRFAQGVAGAAGIVISRAIVRDLYNGAAAARLFSRLMLVIGVAPIAAPALGAELLRLTPWRGLFVVLALVGGLIFLLAALYVPETLKGRMPARGVRGSAAALLAVAVRPSFLSFAVIQGLVLGALFTYIAGSSFVFERAYGVTPETYGILFGANALGLVAFSQVNGSLVLRFGPARLLRVGMLVGLLGSLVLAVGAAGGLGLVVIIPALFTVVASFGLVAPNATALALEDLAEHVGTGSGLLGVLGYVIGAAVAPLAGLGSRPSATPMSAAILGLELAAFLLLIVVSRRRQLDAEPAQALA